MKRIMAYTMNPYLPKVRMKAVRLVRSGWSMRKVSRHIGVNVSTVSRWCKKAPDDARAGIPTLSSKPNSSPKEISSDIKDMIVAERLKHGRCGNVIHQVLLRRDIAVSLSTVNRVLDRGGYLKKKSKWKRLHKYEPPVKALNPGDLVQIDTIHLLPDPYKLDYTKWYIYTLIDINSRWVYAKATKKIGAKESLKFVREAKVRASFRFRCIQSDNGPEFSKYFTQNIKTRHRHTRVRKPTDNAYIERFNRTIQDECIKILPKSIDELNDWIDNYLVYYNNERLHMGIEYLTPREKLSLMLQRS